MVKKLLLVAVLGALAFGALKGTKFFGYAKNEIEAARAWAEDQIPVEKEIARLRKEIASLDKDANKVNSELAREIVDLRILKENTDELRVAVKRDEDKVQAMAKLIPDGKDNERTVSIGRETLTIGEAKGRLKLEVNSLMTKKASLDASEKSIAVRERNKDTLERTRTSMTHQKNELKVQVDTLESEFKALQLQQVESKYQADATRLSGIKQSLADLKRKLAIQQEELKLRPTIREESTTSTQSVDEILAPLGNGKKDGSGS
jgi:hypothetical protein